jgi:hypothetical protein
MASRVGMAGRGGRQRVDLLAGWYMISAPRTGMTALTRP